MGGYALMVIGLTGFYCSGKSTVDKILSGCENIFVIDVDKLGHQALLKSKDKLIKQFGIGILDEDKNIDRKKLGAIVFSDKALLEKLNSIVHPVMVWDTVSIINENKDKTVVISAALLFDMGLDKYCDKIFIVNASLLKIIMRARKRDGYNLKRIFSIIGNQKLKQLLNRTTKNDDIYYINNNGSISKLKKKLTKLLIQTGVFNVRL